MSAIFLLLGFLLTTYVGDRNQRQELSQLERDATLAAVTVLPGVRAASASMMAQSVRQISSATGSHVMILTLDGTPLADSATDVFSTQNQSQTQEFKHALAGSTSSVERTDPVSAQSRWYIAAPVSDNGRIIAVVRLSIPSDQLVTAASGESRNIFLLLLGAACVTLVSVWVFTRTAVRPLSKIVSATQQFSSGDLSARAPVEGSGDFADVAVAFNEMADELQSTFNMIDLERKRLDSVVEHLGDGILIIDNDDQVALMNLSAEKLLRVYRGWAIGRTYPQVFRDYELAAVVRDGRVADSLDAEPATHFIEMGRPRRTVQAFSYPIPSDDAPLVLVVLRDITEFRRTEAVRRDFVANVSHDLRTPIASMKALVETLLDGALEDETVARDFLSRIQVEVDDLARLVEELLQLSRAEAGQINLHLAPGNVEPIVRRVIDRMRAQASLKQIEISLDSDAELPRAMFDSDRIEQVLVNLVHNAVKFTPVGGKITLVLKASDEAVITSVHDSGPGLESGDLERVFERFYKADRSRSAAGSGLGLAIAKHLIQLHGGRIWAESDYGRGATFSFSLPRTELTDDEVSESETPPRIPTQLPTSRGKDSHTI